MISIAHAPNTTREQQSLAKRLLAPWRLMHLKRGLAIGKLEQWFRIRFQTVEAVSFATGREALLAVLQALKIGAGDEVIIQSYTCIVVPHAVYWSGAKPVYADIDDTLNMELASVKRAISKNTKAVIVQHTFGNPADLAAIKQLCDEHNIVLIEDVAHAFGASFNGKEVGSFGDAAIFSFGRDKILSSTSGGMAIMRRHEPAQRLRAIQTSGKYPSYLWIKQNLLHTILVPWCLKHFRNGRLGAIALRAFQMVGVLNKVYGTAELDSKAPRQQTRRMPNAMAELARQQLHDQWLDFQTHRRAIAAVYTDWAIRKGLRFQQSHPASEPAFLRWTMFTDHPQNIMAAARKQGFILGDWYTHSIMPEPHDEALLSYHRESCPKAEAAASRSLNLPTHHLIKIDQAIALTELIEGLL